MQFCTLNKLKKGKFDTDLNCHNIKKIKKKIEGFPQLHQNMVTLANADINNNESENENTGIDSNSNFADESHE